MSMARTQGLLHGRSRRSGRQAAEPAPAGEERTVSSADGTALYVQEFGGREAAGTVVLAHGYWQSSRLWAGQIRDLTAARPDLRVVAYDHRGHGRSARCTRESSHIAQLGSDLATVLDAVAPHGPVVLAGHSMGGMTIMALAEERPELFGNRIVGAAFVATSAGGLADVTYGLPRPVAKAVLRAVPRLQAKAIRDEQAGKPHRLAPGTKRLIFGPGADPADVRMTLDDMLCCSAETAAAFFETFADHDRRHALGALRDIPAMVVVGDHDLLCPLEHSKAIAAELPMGELSVYPGAGHMVQLERRPEVSRRLLELLDRAIPAVGRTPSNQPVPAGSSSA
jgi:pimeloyl-ACP methyl ester carboxylesterase